MAFKVTRHSLAFAQLSKLGKDKKLAIDNALLRGTSTVEVARMIHGWGMWAELREDALAKLLAKYRSTKLGTLQPEELGLENIKVASKVVDGKIDAMDALRRLAQQQQHRVETLITKDEGDQKYRSTTSNEMTILAMLLKDVLRAEFECGERGYHMHPKSPGVQASVTLPGGTTIEVKEAASVASEIMARRSLLDGKKVTDALPGGN